MAQRRRRRGAWPGAGSGDEKRAAPARVRDDRTVARELALDDAVDAYLDHLKVERGLAVHTVDSYGRDMARLVRELSAAGRINVDEVTPLDITDHIGTMATQGLAARSRARALVAVRGLFRYLVAERWLDADPTALIDAPKFAARPRITRSTRRSAPNSVPAPTACGSAIKRARRCASPPPPTGCCTAPRRAPNRR